MGLEYSRQLAAKGYDLVIVSNREEELERARAELEASYPVRIITLCRDLAKEGAAQDLLSFCGENALDVDVLICNAGIFFFGELSPEMLPKVYVMIRLHITTITEMCILFGEGMKKRGKGNIIIVSSLAASLSAPGIILYSSTKSYLRTFGKSLYAEMRPFGVWVTTVCPAAVATSLYKLDPKLMDIAVKTGVIWTPKRLVRRALRAMKYHRRCIRPGIMNYYLPFIVESVPNWMMERIWNKVRAK